MVYKVYDIDCQQSKYIFIHIDLVAFLKPDSIWNNLEYLQPVTLSHSTFVKGLQEKKKIYQHNARLPNLNMFGWLFSRLQLILNNFLYL